MSLSPYLLLFWLFFIAAPAGAQMASPLPSPWPRPSASAPPAVLQGVASDRPNEGESYTSGISTEDLQGYTIVTPSGQRHTLLLKDTGVSPQQIENMLNNSLLQNILGSSKSQGMLAALEKMLLHSQRWNFLLAEFGAFLFVLAFKAWRIKSSRERLTWSRRAWVWIYSFVLFLVLSLGLIPALFFSDLYYSFLRSLVG